MLSGKEKDAFIEFIKKMVKWNPEDRSSAKDLLKDPWLHTDFVSFSAGRMVKQ
jgi:serine/threonine-protein kinase SRPK3